MGTVKMIVLAGALLLALPLSGPAGAQGGRETAGPLLAAYDLLVAGKLDQAQQAYHAILKKEPNNPIALNNLAAIMVQRGNYPEARRLLQQALRHARGERISLDRPCDIGGLCVAYRTTDSSFGSEDLTEMIKINLVAVEIAAASAAEKRGPEKR